MTTLNTPMLPAADGAEEPIDALMRLCAENPNDIEIVVIDAVTGKQIRDIPPIPASAFDPVALPPGSYQLRPRRRSDRRFVAGSARWHSVESAHAGNPNHPTPNAYAPAVHHGGANVPSLGAGSAAPYPADAIGLLIGEMRALRESLAAREPAREPAQADRMIEFARIMQERQPRDAGPWKEILGLASPLILKLIEAALKRGDSVGDVLETAERIAGRISAREPAPSGGGLDITGLLAQLPEAIKALAALKQPAQVTPREGRGGNEGAGTSAPVTVRTVTQAGDDAAADQRPIVGQPVPAAPDAESDDPVDQVALMIEAAARHRTPPRLAVGMLAASMLDESFTAALKARGIDPERIAAGESPSAIAAALIEAMPRLSAHRAYVESLAATALELADDAEPAPAPAPGTPAPNPAPTPAPGTPERSRRQRAKPEPKEAGP